MWGDARDRSPCKVEFGTTSGCFQEEWFMGVLVGGSETIQSPRLTPCPARVVSPTLVGRLPQELACFEVKQALVRGASVAPHQEPACGKTMFGSDLPQSLILGLVRRVKNDSDIH